MKGLKIILILVGLLAISLMWSVGLTSYYCQKGSCESEDYYEGILRNDLEEKLEAQGLLPHEIRKLTDSQVWLLAEFGREAADAEKLFPEQAVTMYALYGKSEELHKALDFGYKRVIPVLWYFFKNEDAYAYEVRDMISQAVLGFKEKGAKEAWNSVKKAWETPLNADQRVWIAINRVTATNGGYLSQFRIKDGVAYRSQIGRVFSFTQELLTSDLQSLEWKYQTGERVTTGEVVGASLEVLFFAAVGAKTLHTLSKAGKIATVATKGSKTGGIMARSVALVPTLAANPIVRMGTYGLGVYLLVTHPSTFNAGIAVVAETLGMSPRVLQIIVWSVVLYPIVFIIMWILHMVVRPARAIYRLAK